MTVRQIRGLSHGAEVMVTWSGGNGPWPYRIYVTRYGQRCVDNPFHDPLLNGRADQKMPMHRVTLGWDDAAREHYAEKTR